MPVINKLKFGLIINPFAGIGGKVGLKGSDGEAIREEAFARGAVAQAIHRASIALESLVTHKQKVEWYSVEGAMGGSLLNDLGFDYQAVYQATEHTKAEDTKAAVEQFNLLDLDLLVFAGGDGTARDICQVVNPKQVVLGIPAGVKIHSGVYALTPAAAGKVMQEIITNRLVSLIEASVMDLDEDEYRQGTVRAKQYGQMLVPAEHQYIQATKVSSSQLSQATSPENELRVQRDIAEFVVENMEDDVHYLVGSGTSCGAIMEALDLPNSLLGIDCVYQEKLVSADLTESDILQILNEHPNKVKVIVTVIGGQGHILGRGNHQLSSRVMTHLSKDDLIIIATKTKINQLANKPLVVDLDDPAINQKLSGLFSVITGYDDEIFYQVGLNS